MDALIRAFRWPLLMVLAGISPFLFGQPDQYVPDRDVVFSFHQSSPEYREGILVVKFRPSVQIEPDSIRTQIAGVNRLLEVYGVTALRPAFPNLPYTKFPGAQALRQVCYLELSPELDPASVAQTFMQLPEVEYAEPDFLYGLTDVPDDPSYEFMDQFDIIQAEAAWDLVKGDTSPVVIAILDGGTDWRHKDLANNVWTNPDEIPDNGKDDDRNGFVDDVNGWDFPENHPDPTGSEALPGNRDHGTHVAGIAAAVTDNGRGISSLSWNCTFMPVNVSHETFDRVIGYSVHGIIYATIMGADIINCSWGGRGYSYLLEEVVTFARDNGSLVVASAGNNDTNNDARPFYPAMYQHVLSVGANRRSRNQVASFTNYGISVDVYAPGTVIFSTIAGDKYEFSSGTSMSSPMVAALAALVKTRYPNLTPDQIAERIRMTCDTIRTANPELADSTGKGRINAHRALLPLTSPAIRVLQIDPVSRLNGDEIYAGDTVDLAVTVINYLDPTGDISFRLESDSSVLKWIDSTDVVVSLQTLETRTLGFQFVVDTQLSTLRLPFFLHTEDSSTYQDAGFFALQAVGERPRFLTQTTDSISVSITNEGNVGWLDMEGSEGDGFVYRGTNFLFEGGLIMANRPDRIISTVRGENPFEQRTPFEGISTLRITSSGIAGELGSVVLEDTADILSTQLRVEQLSLSRFPENPELDNSLMLTFNLVNLGLEPVRNLYVGLFMDWDMPPGSIEVGSIDPARRTVLIADSEANPNTLLAVKLLNRNYVFNGRLIDNQAMLGDGFSSAEKWEMLTKPPDSLLESAGDLSTLVTAGPFEVAVFDEVEVGFLLTAVASDSALAQSHAHANRIYSRYFRPRNPAPPVSIDADVKHEPELSLFPNPFSSSVTIGYRLHTSQFVELTILNMLGEKIRTLVDEEWTLPGLYDVSWDGYNHTGVSVSPGMYIVRIKTDGKILSRKLINVH